MVDLSARAANIVNEMAAMLAGGNIHAVQIAAKALRNQGLDPNIQLRAALPLLTRTLQTFLRRGQDYQERMNAPDHSFRTVLHLLEPLEFQDWPELAEILEDNKNVLIKDLLYRMKEGWTASALLAVHDLQRWGRRWPELATIERTALDDVDREVDESRDDYYTSTENLLRYLRQDFDKSDYDAALEIIGELAWTTHPGQDLSKLLNAHKAGLMRAMLTTMSNNDRESVQYIMPQYLGGLEKFGAHWPEFETIEKSLDAMAREPSPELDEAYALGKPASPEINHLFDCLENGDGYYAVQSLYNLTDEDLDPSYAEEIAPFEDVITRGMLEWAKDEAEWMPTVLVAIGTLHDIGLTWPALETIQKSALNDYNQLTETNPAYAKQDAERAVRGVSANLEKMRKTQSTNQAWYELIDAIYGVLGVNRGYADLTTPVLEHYKPEILRVILKHLRSSIDSGREISYMETIFDALDRARISWPEIDIMKRSMRAGLGEAWSKKYKRSINCSHPKGFSQKAHCAARRKRARGGKTKSKSVRENINPMAINARNPVLKSRDPRKVEPTKLGTKVDVRRENPRDLDKLWGKKPPRNKVPFSLDDKLDEAIRGQQRWIQRVADNLAWDFEHKRDLEIGYTIQKLNQTDPSEVQEIFAPLAQKYADWFQHMVDTDNLWFGIRELDRLLGYIKQVYPEITAAVDHNKTAIIRALLTLFREEHYDQANHYIWLLRDLGVKWPELETIRRSLSEGDDSASAALRDEARDTVIGIFARDLQKNGSRGIYYVMYHMDDWGLKLKDWPEVAEMIDDHKRAIVKELLKTVNGDFNDDQQVNRESARFTIDRMKRIGVEWPELDVIEKSIDADQPQLTEDEHFEWIMELIASHMADMATHLETGPNVWLVGELSEIYSTLENENLDPQYYPNPDDWDLDLEANKNKFVKGILEAIKLGEGDEAVNAVHMLKDYWHVRWPEFDIILKSANADQPKELDELKGYRADPVYRAAKRELKPSKMKTASERDMAMEKLTDYLEDQGFKHIGQGSFSEIYLKPGYPWMFKLWSHDPAYLWWITWAAKHQDNPNVPRVKGLPVQIAPDTYVVRLEKLRSRGAYDHTQLADLLNNVETIDDISKEDLQWIRKEYPGIYDALRVIQRAGSSFVVDLHSDNIMMRGQTPVLVDPVVG